MPPKKYNFEHILKEEIKTLFLEQKIEAKKWDRTLQKQLVQERADETAAEETAEEAAAGEDLDFIQKDQYQYGWDVGKTRAYGVPGDLISDPTPYPDTFNERLLMTYARDQHTGGSDGKCPHDSGCRRAAEKRIRRLKKSLMYYRSECSRSIYRGRAIREYDKEGLAACKMVVKLEYELEEREKHIPIERKNYKKEIATGKYIGDAASRSRYLDFKDRLSNMNKEANKKAWKLRKVRRQNLYDFKKRWGCFKKTDKKEKNKRRNKLNDLWDRSQEEAMIRLEYLEEIIETAGQGRMVRKQNSPDQWYANIKLYWDLIDGGFIAGGNDTVAKMAWRKALYPGAPISRAKNLESFGGIWRLYRPHRRDWQEDPSNPNPAGLAGGRMIRGDPHPGSISGVPKLACKPAWAKRLPAAGALSLPEWEGQKGEEGTVGGRQGGGSIVASPKLINKLQSLFKSSPKWAALAEKYRKRFNWDPSVEGRSTTRKYALGDSLAFTRAYWQKYIIPPPNALVCFMMHKIKTEQWVEFRNPQTMADYQGMRKIVNYLTTDMYENGKLTGFLPICSRITRDIVDAGPPYNSKDIVIGFDTKTLTCKEMDVIGNAPGQIPPASTKTGSDLACTKHKLAVVNGRKRLVCAEETSVPIYANPERQEAHETGKKNVGDCYALTTSGRPVLRYDLDKALRYFKNLCGPARFFGSGGIQINGFGMPWAYESNIRAKQRAETKKQCKEIFECYGATCWEKYIPEYKEYLKFKQDCEKKTCSPHNRYPRGGRKRCIASCMEPTKDWFKPGEALHGEILNAKIEKAKQTCKIEQDGGWVDRNGEPVMNRKVQDTDRYVPSGEGGSLDVSEEDGLGLGSPFVIPQRCLPTGVDKQEATGITGASEWFAEMFLQPEDVAIEVGTGIGLRRTLLGRLLGIFTLVLFAQCDNPPCHGSEEEMEIWKAKVAAEDAEVRERELDNETDDTLDANKEEAYPEGKDLVPGAKEEE